MLRICPVCLGRGTIEIFPAMRPSAEAYFVDCEFCRAEGYIDWNDNKLPVEVNTISYNKETIDAAANILIAEDRKEHERLYGK
jgi:hypothetical protein